MRKNCILNQKSGILQCRMNQALGSLPIVIHIKAEAFPFSRVDAPAVSYNVGAKDKSPATFFGLQFIHRTHLLSFLHFACSGSAYCALSMAQKQKPKVAGRWAFFLVTTSRTTDRIVGKGCYPLDKLHRKNTNYFNDASKN